MIMIETYIIDSFTDEPFKGNPAGVCLIKNELSERQMLSIAKELGLSETAFVKPIVSGKYSIRYYSPKKEIPLCGHATMAASKALFEGEKLSQVHFVNSQNLEICVQHYDGLMIMEFPIYNTEPISISLELLKALDIDKFENCRYNKELNIILIEINDCLKLKHLKPDFEKLKKANNSINGVVITALSDRASFDFESRYFWPWSGTNEDPVTGGTHTFLSKYWGDKLNKTKMKSFQCSQRTGFMELELLDEGKVLIKSKAQIILKGELKI